MFYKRLQQFCVEKGVSMQKVAADIGISPAAISKWSKGGKPNNANARALADYFGTSTAELLGGIEVMSQFSAAQCAPALSGSLADAYADLKRDYAECRAMVQSQQDTLRNLSESGKNMSESNKNFSESNKNFSEASKNWSEASKNWSTSNRNLSESNKSLAESIKSLAVGGGSPKDRR
jgi:transcriptional regulator with XRE-family HTH domain